MPRLSQPVRAVSSTALPIAAAVVGAFLVRKVFGAAVSVVAMLAVGRLLLTALKIDLALAQRRTTRPAAESTEAS